MNILVSSSLQNGFWITFFYCKLTPCPLEWEISDCQSLKTYLDSKSQCLFQKRCKRYDYRFYNFPHKFSVLKKFFSLRWFLPKAEGCICTIWCNWNLINAWMGLLYGLPFMECACPYTQQNHSFYCHLVKKGTTEQFQISRSNDNRLIESRRFFGGETNELAILFRNYVYIIHPDSKMIYKWNKMEINVICMMFSKHYQNNHCIGVVFQTNCERRGHVWF